MIQNFFLWANEHVSYPGTISSDYGTSAAVYVLKIWVINGDGPVPTNCKRQLFVVRYLEKREIITFFSQELSYYTFRNFCEFVFIALRNWKIGFFSFRLPAGLAQTFCFKHIIRSSYSAGRFA
jgi:hypothetical protein